MYSSCLVCRTPFSPNRRLQHLPLGERVAYDIHRGRLWVICDSCRRWSLAPMEERWEALEELERMVAGGGGGRTKARLISGTDHISLFGVGSLKVVRVGPADLPEEAWWRYGQQLTDSSVLGRRLPKLSRRVRLGAVAWRGEGKCAGCGQRFTEIPFADRRLLFIRPGEETGAGAADPGAGTADPGAGTADPGSSGPTSGGPTQPPALIRRCPRCKEVNHGGLVLQGTQAELTLARILAYEDLVGASLDRVRTAARMVQDPDGPRTLVRILTRYGKSLDQIPPIGILALEITAMDAREGRLMRLELEELKFRWRQEEEFAALIDGDLTPVPLLGKLIRGVRGEG